MEFDIVDLSDDAPISPLKRRVGEDMLAASRMLDRDQARFLVADYYMFQEQRIRAGNQARALSAADKPTDVIDYFGGQMSALELQIRSTLDAWTAASEVGQWARSNMGVGPVLAAGFMAHIDITRAPTVGHIWRLAGLDPTFEWLGRDRAVALVDDTMRMLGAKRIVPTNRVEIVQALASRSNRRYESLERMALKHGNGKITVASLQKALAVRPWNADLKLLQWKLGQSFIKVSNREAAYYGHLYRRRKALEQSKNEAKDFAELAAKTMDTKRIAVADTVKWYKEGMLPPGRIDLRAQRFAVKIWLSHFHEVAYVDYYGELPPRPFAIEHLGHAHEFVMPNMPERIRQLREAAKRPLGE